MNMKDKKKNAVKNKKASGKILAAAVCCAFVAAFLFAPQFLFPAPQDVSGLVASEASYDSVKLEWNDSADATEYYVYRSEENKPFMHIATVTKSAFRDTSLLTGHKYQYKIAVSNLINTSDNNATIGVVARLNTPVISGDVSKGSIKVDIQNVEGANKYDIKRNDKHVAFVDASDGKSTTFKDVSADTDKEYEYTVTACRDDAESSESEPVNLELISVSKLTAKVNDDDLLITWDNDDTYSEYKLYNNGDLVCETKDTSCALESQEDSIYDLTLVGFSEDLKSPPRNQTFKVMEAQMTNEEAIDAACEWGIGIANDNSFSYGTGKHAHSSGCYFCGTNWGPNKYKKAKGYEKTYCCNPFVTACFAHGAKDPALLALCQAGKTLHMNRKSFEDHGSWEYVGHPSQGSLKRGDVLVASSKLGKGSRNHLALYIGSGQIVHARKEGWNAPSIAVTKLGSRYYSVNYDFVMRYTGEGGIQMKAVEITEDKASGKNLQLEQ